MALPDEPEARLSAMLRTALDCIITIDQDDRVIEFNDAAERTFGYRRADVLGRELAGLIIPAELRGRHRERLARYLATGETTILDRRVEVMAQRADGSRFPAELAVTRVASSPPLFTAYLRDITERQRAEWAMRESEQRFRTVVEQVKDYAIFTMDVKGRATSWNEGVKRVLGFDHDEFVGVEIATSIFTPEDVRDGVPQRELATAAAEGRAGDDRWMQRKDGTRFFAFGVTTAVQDMSGNLTGYSKIMRDQTPRKLMEDELRRTAEDLMEAAKQQTRFLAILSHELRNPLAPIRNSVEILRLADVENPGARSAVEMIGRQVTHLVRLIDDLLDLSRIRGGKVELRRERRDVADAVKEAVDGARAHCEPLKQALRVELPDEPLFVDADATRIVQVVGNLLQNACKFTPDGGRVGLTLRREGVQAVIRVHDTGVGIPKDKLESIFEMFAQLEHTVDRPQGGLGLGLHLSRSLAQMHGGTLEARSEGLGKGSEFVLRLPLSPAPGESA
ncbi:MAG: PAS domain S-box protein [Pseudomonadota bacterium]|nr:PAS domain S-box protein [Pseudomonadota bacterium]